MRREIIVVEGDVVVQGNRDMGIAVHWTELANQFADLVARDMRQAQGEPPNSVAAGTLPANSVIVPGTGRRIATRSNNDRVTPTL